ncbi:MAG: hypothetical protein KDN18_16670 [Verrucomicrobiae bacterium]|nr:hypothetical protein [Verrucomicrobiae bacterium]
MEASSDRDFGLQPLDALLAGLGLDNHALVSASTDQLTHKQVQKGRRGKYITVNIQRKIQKALNAAVPPGEDGEKVVFQLGDLFNYRP